MSRIMFLKAPSYKTLGLHRIEAHVDEENDRSTGVLKKLGFTYEGTSRESVFIRDRFWYQYSFGLLKDEWKQAKAPKDI